MALLIVGLVLFLGAHSIAIAAPAWRGRMVTRLGLSGYRAGYAVVSLAGFVAIVYGYAEARQAPILFYGRSDGMAHFAMLLLVPVFPLLLATYLPGRIQSTLKHPMLVAVKLWALAHLLVNGTVADLILFGSFLAWAVIDRISLKRRTPESPPSAPAGKLNDLIALVLGLVIYVVFVMYLHRLLIGVPPIG